MFINKMLGVKNKMEKKMISKIIAIAVLFLLSVSFVSAAGSYDFLKEKFDKMVKPEFVSFAVKQ